MKRILLAAIIILITINIFARQSEIISNIQTKYSNLKTFEANIIQTNHFPEHDTSFESHGKIFIDNENIVIEYNEPNYQFIKIENNELTIYSRNENLASISNNDETNSVSFLHFSYLLNQNLMLVDKIENTSIFSIHEPPHSLISLILYIDESTNLIHKIEYVDDMSNTVSIDISNQQFNENLSKTIDSFIVPRGTIILDQ